MQQIQKQKSKWPTRMRVIGFILALLVLIVGATVWVLNSLNSLPALFATIFGALAVIIAFIQLIPIIFPPKSSEHSLTSRPASTMPPINIYNVIPSSPSATPAVSTSPPEHDQPTNASSRSSSLTLRAFPLPTDLRSIQQREEVVKEIYALIIDVGTAAVVLTGIGGIGKSTLAALVLNYAERERQAGRGPFQRESVMLRINENTTFLELAANLFAAVDKNMPDLSGVPPQNQAFAIVNALNTIGAVDKPRLIILDQFENLLDPQSGQALLMNAGVGELIDALNSLPCASRLLLTSRPRPRGTRIDAPASLRIYAVGGLDKEEGMALLRSQGIAGSEAELSEAVKRCNGHALSLTLLSPLLQSYGVSLATLLNDPAYRQLWEGRIADKLLDRIFENLSEPSRQLLCACSVYREAVPIEALLAVSANATKTQVLTTLGSLLEQHLVQAQATSGHYLLHPIVATYSEQHFVVNDVAANKRAMQTAHNRAAQYYVQLAAAHCPAFDKRGQVSDVQPLIEAVWQYCQAAAYQEAYDLMENESLFAGLRRWGGNTILLELCKLLLAENWQFTPQQKALIYSNIASTSGVLGQKQEALKYYEQALKLHKKVQNPFMEGITFHNIGMIYSSQHRYEIALACILLVKALFERVQSSSDVDDEVQWIANLRQRIGEEQFARLLAQVEPRTEQIVEETLLAESADHSQTQ
jgi:tetratricopeptide (TPR) repeat protein